ncbi:hypothetical protein JXA85_04300, partial [Candidatus Woesearchaeota archaeon]|nr:hypothetical protein [Candidatus Woesearchaeota archaeon]
LQHLSCYKAFKFVFAFCLMPCRYCGESDPFKLTLSTRAVNGKAESREVCFNCYWLEKFEQEVREMRDGASLRREERIFEERELSELPRRIDS